MCLASSICRSHHQRLRPSCATAPDARLLPSSCIFPAAAAASQSPWNASRCLRACSVQYSMPSGPGEMGEKYWPSPYSPSMRQVLYGTQGPPEGLVGLAPVGCICRNGLLRVIVAQVTVPASHRRSPRAFEEPLTDALPLGGRAHHSCSELLLCQMDFPPVQ